MVRLDARPFLCMHSENMAQNPLNIVFLATVQVFDHDGSNGMIKSETESRILPLLHMRSANRPKSALSSHNFTDRFSGMSDQMAWSDLMPEVVFWPFLRMRSENMAQNTLSVAFLARISLLFRFSTMPDRMAWWDLKSEVAFRPLLHMQMWLKMPTISRCSHDFVTIYIMAASSDHRCSIECSPSHILVRSITNSPQYTQLQCGRNPRSALQNVIQCISSFSLNLQWCPDPLAHCESSWAAVQQKVGSLTLGQCYALFCT